MLHPAARPPFLPLPVLRGVKVVVGLLAAGIAAVGGAITFGIAVEELWHGAQQLLSRGDASNELAIVYVVKSIDAVLLGLVQFLLAAFLWQILDPRESLVEEENMLRLEEAKQMLCKVVLVIVAVRMLGVLIEKDGLLWQHFVFPAGIVALAFATTSLQKGKESKAAE